MVLFYCDRCDKDTTILVWCIECCKDICVDCDPEFHEHYSYERGDWMVCVDCDKKLKLERQQQNDNENNENNQ